MKIIKDKEEFQMISEIINYLSHEDTRKLAHNLILKHIIKYRCRAIKPRGSSSDMFILCSIPVDSDSRIITMFYDTHSEYSIEFYIHNNENYFNDEYHDFNGYYARIYFNDSYSYSSEYRLDTIMSSIKKHLKVLNILL